VVGEKRRERLQLWLPPSKYVEVREELMVVKRGERAGQTRKRGRESEAEKRETSERLPSRSAVSVDSGTVQTKGRRRQREIENR